MKDIQDGVRIIAGYLRQIGGLRTVQELSELSDKILKELGVEPEDKTGLFEAWKNASALGTELVRFKNVSDDSARLRRLAQLTEDERTELEIVEKILDENLFTYHFQPIVSAVDGEIYSYEALMRAGSYPRITPLQILKYAELTGRLGDIEKDTFVNILRFLEEQAEMFGGRPVFINSIPNSRLSSEDMELIGGLLEKNRSNTVVEMTEQAEFDEYELGAMKERYHKMNIPIAIDDYGTGYSNVKNLLRYTPNFVKIDRALLSGVENDPQKRHFVREIIDFCHDNGILALAEGVETAEELRAVILFGVDLLQGFYIARPSPEVIPSIPEHIKEEIKRYHQERVDGRATQIYHAEAGERIALERLVKEGYTCVRISGEKAGDLVSVVGGSSLDTDIHIDIADGFRGRLLLEDAHLSNVFQRPCIDIQRGCAVGIELKGHNKLEPTGIRVPEGAEVVFTGSGDSSLEIHLDCADHYGIGCDMKSGNGCIIFDQDSAIKITSDSQSGVLIGSGLGGDISIRRGMYKLKARGDKNVAIGALTGSVRMEIQNCDLQIHVFGNNSLGIGSLMGAADVFVHSASVKCISSGMAAAGIGTLGEESSDVHIDCVNIYLTVQADKAAVLGSMGGTTKVCVERSVFSVTGRGYESLVFGGVKGCDKAEILNCECSIDLETDYERLAFIDRIRVVGGHSEVILNKESVELA